MGRLVVFIYGIAAYCVFLITWLFAIAFVGDLDSVVPKTIDTGPQVSFAHALIVNIILIGIWTVPHSLMARQRFKSWWTNLNASKIRLLF